MTHYNLPLLCCSSKRLTLQTNLQVVCGVCLILLAGCSADDFADLNQYVAAVKARPKGPIPPLPETKIIESFIFKPEGLRDPFKPPEQPEQAQGVDISTGSGIKPYTTRRK